MKVRATQVGYYDGYIRNPGDVFEISEQTIGVTDEKGIQKMDSKGKAVTKIQFFSDKWMERVSENEPLTTVQKPKGKHPLDVLRNPIESPKTFSEAQGVI